MVREDSESAEYCVGVREDEMSHSCAVFSVFYPLATGHWPLATAVLPSGQGLELLACARGACFGGAGLVGGLGVAERRYRPRGRVALRRQPHQRIAAGGSILPPLPAGDWHFRPAEPHRVPRQPAGDSPPNPGCRAAAVLAAGRIPRPCGIAGPVGHADLCLPDVFRHGRVRAGACRRWPCP